MDRALRLLSWAALATGLASAVAAATVSRRTATRPGPPATTTRAAVVVPRARSDSMVTLVVNGDVFRSDRRAARVAYDPGPAGESEPEELAKPRLRLVGIVLGAGARALIEGLPGVSGARLLAPGDSFGGLRVVSITTRQVRVAGLDTTWALTLERRP